jgi:hypothetical protein
VTRVNRSYLAASIVGAVLVAALSAAGMLLVAGGHVMIPLGQGQTQGAATATHAPPSDHTSIQGIVVSIRYIGSTFTVQRDDTGANVVIAVNEATQFTGAATAFSDLQTGAHVSVQGQLRSDGSMIASAVQVSGG